MESLKNANVIVIGATGIIGKGAALTFAEAGARLVVGVGKIRRHQSADERVSFGIQHD